MDEKKLKQLKPLIDLKKKKSLSAFLALRNAQKSLKDRIKTLEENSLSTAIEDQKIVDKFQQWCVQERKRLNAELARLKVRDESLKREAARASAREAVVKRLSQKR